MKKWWDINLLVYNCRWEGLHDQIVRSAYGLLATGISVYPPLSLCGWAQDKFARDFDLREGWPTEGVSDVNRVGAKMKMTFVDLEKGESFVEKAREAKVLDRFPDESKFVVKAQVGNCCKGVHFFERTLRDGDDGEDGMWSDLKPIWGGCPTRGRALMILSRGLAASLLRASSGMTRR